MTAGAKKKPPVQKKSSPRPKGEIVVTGHAITETDEHGKVNPWGSSIQLEIEVADGKGGFEFGAGTHVRITQGYNGALSPTGWEADVQVSGRASHDTELGRARAAALIKGCDLADMFIVCLRGLSDWRDNPAKVLRDFAAPNAYTTITKHSTDKKSGRTAEVTSIEVEERGRR